MSQRPDISELDAIVLAGGNSRRMGSPKATLPFGGTTLAGAVVAALQTVFRQVLVVTREQASLSDCLSGFDVEILEDERPLQGPLVGVVRGLAHSDAPWCFVAGCDMPYLRVDVILRMAEHLDDGDVVIPRYNGRLQTLHAFYNRRCLRIAEELLEQGLTSMGELLSHCRVSELSQDHFADISGALLSFQDLDTGEEYEATLQTPDSPSE